MADDAPGGSPDQPAPPPAGGPSADSRPEAPTTAFAASAPPSDEPPTRPLTASAEPTTAFASSGAGSTTVLTDAPASGAAPNDGAAPNVGAALIDGAAPIDGAGPPFAAPAAAVVAPNGRRTGWRRWLPLVGVISFIAICSVVMLLILGFSNGITGLLVGLVAAILPVPVLVGCFLWLDRYEPEPTRYLVFCFAWGSSVATLVALGVNTGGAFLFDRIGLPDALVAVLVAPFIEETMKALGPILLLWRRRREWSGITDGIVYCGLSAIGFAMVENVLYLGGHGYAAGADQYGPATGIQNVFLIFIVRILFTGFAHPLFTSMAGVGLGVASRAGDRRVKWLAPIAGILVAMILHGLFNLLPTLSVATGQTLIMLYGYLGFMVPFFFLTVGFAIALRGWEGRLSERVLPHYVRTGWLSPPEVAALGNLGRRHSARSWAKRVAGPDGLKAMRSFQFAATRLAILRDGMQRGLDRKPEDIEQTAAEEQRLLAAISGYRSVFVGRDPQMPQAFWDGSRYRIAFPDGVTRTVDAPPEPVVPLPVRLAPAGPGYWPGYGYGAYGNGVQAPPAYGQGLDVSAGPVGVIRQSTPPPGYQPGPGYPAPPAYPPPYQQYGYQQPGQPQPGHQQGAYQPPGYQQPTYQQSGYQQPGYQQSGYQQPGYQQPGYQQPGYQQPGYQQPGYQQPSYQQPGYQQPGYQQPGAAYPQYSYAQPGYPHSGEQQPYPTYQQSAYQQPAPQAQPQPDHQPPAPSHPHPDQGAPPHGGPPPAQPDPGAPARPVPENPPSN